MTPRYKFAVCILFLKGLLGTGDPRYQLALCGLQASLYKAANKFEGGSDSGNKQKNDQ